MLFNRLTINRLTEPRPSGSVAGLAKYNLLDLRRSLTVAARLMRVN